MGYYTDYKITQSGEYVDENSLEEELNNITGYGWGSDLSLYDAKWYDFDKDMKAFSKLHPNTIFQLDGEGEESPDIWRSYYKNGKHQSANTEIKIIHEPFDESKLK